MTDICIDHPIKNLEKALKQISNFCPLLQGNKVKESKSSFVKLPLLVQCLFLNHGWEILSGGPKKFSENVYRNGFYLFKLFRGGDLKELPLYKNLCRRVGRVEQNYKKALEWSRTNKPKKTPAKSVREKKSKVVEQSHRRRETVSSVTTQPEVDEDSDLERPVALPSGDTQPKKRTEKKTTTKKEKTKYEKAFQKKETPDKASPLYIFYTTLYEEKPDSRLAIKWLTEYGVFNGSKRERLVEKYKGLY